MHSGLLILGVWHAAKKTCIVCLPVLKTIMKNMWLDLDMRLPCVTRVEAEWLHIRVVLLTGVWICHALRILHSSAPNHVSYVCFRVYAPSHLWKHVCVCACNVCMHTRMYVCMYIFKNVYVYMCSYACMYICMCVCICVFNKWVYVHACVRVIMHAFTYVCLHMRI